MKRIEILYGASANNIERQYKSFISDKSDIGTINIIKCDLISHKLVHGNYELVMTIIYKIDSTDSTKYS